MAAGGEGRLDGLYSGLIGLIIGAGLYAEVYPSLLPGFLKIGALGKATLPQLLSLGVWPTVGLVAGVLGVAVWYLDRVDRRVQKQAQPRGCPVTATL